MASRQFIENFNRTLDDLDADRRKRHPWTTYPYFDFMEDFIMQPEDFGIKPLKTFPVQDDKQRLERENLELKVKDSWWHGFLLATVAYYLGSFTYAIIQGIREGLELLNKQP